MFQYAFYTFYIYVCVYMQIHTLDWPGKNYLSAPIGQFIDSFLENKLAGFIKLEMCIIFDQITLPLKIYPTESFVHSQRHIYDHCKLFFWCKTFDSNWNVHQWITLHSFCQVLCGYKNKTLIKGKCNSLSAVNRMIPFMINKTIK